MGIIELKNICKKFDNKIIFDNYSLTVEEGEFVSIMGKSGKGKTTLLNIIGMLENPDEGSIKICGVENPHFNSQKGIKLLRNDISYLFQNYGLIDAETVEYNLKVAVKFLKLSNKEKQDKIKAVLEKVGLNGFEKKKIYQLSGGEQQRVAVAKLFLKPSKIILADEPTGSLDFENEQIIMKMLQELNSQGRTIVVVTHSKNVMTYATRNIVLE